MNSSTFITVSAKATRKNRLTEIKQKQATNLITQEDIEYLRQIKIEKENNKKYNSYIRYLMISRYITKEEAIKVVNSICKLIELSKIIEESIIQTEYSINNLKQQENGIFNTVYDSLICLNIYIRKNKRDELNRQIIELTEILYNYNKEYNNILEQLDNETWLYYDNEYNIIKSLESDYRLCKLSGNIFNYDDHCYYNCKIIDKLL